MSDSPPSWMQLLTPVPAGVVPERKPVVSAQQIASGTAGPIAGWESVSVHLSDPALGSRHILISLDANGRLLSAGDHVMLVRELSADGAVRIADHESVGGRYADDGSFQGTRWLSRIVCESGDDHARQASSDKSAPTDEDIAALNRLVADLLERSTR